MSMEQMNADRITCNAATLADLERYADLEGYEGNDLYEIAQRRELSCRDGDFVPEVMARIAEEAALHLSLTTGKAVDPNKLRFRPGRKWPLMEVRWRKKVVAVIILQDFPPKDEFNKIMAEEGFSPI